MLENMQRQLLYNVHLPTENLLMAHRCNRLAAVFVSLGLLVTPLIAQVLDPAEVTDRAARELQTKHLPELQRLAVALGSHRFPYPLYFSRTLDISEKDAQQADQRSMRFQAYKGKTMLAMTGNYYISFAATQFNSNARVQKVLQDVVQPILQAADASVKSQDFDGYAFEIAYHVRQKVMGVESENAENVVFLLPRAAAARLAHSTADEGAQAALLDSQVFLNADPFNLWVFGDKPTDEEIASRKQKHSANVAAQTSAPSQNVVAQATATVAPELVNPTATPSRVVLPQTLSALKLTYADKIARLLRDTNSQAHYVSYAPPDFVGFHQGIYLELPVETPLEANVTGSRYKLAALAFDEHISQLLRPTLAYFESSTDFDGLVFSTTLKQSGGTNALAIEFFLPLSQIKCFARYDCTGQQLLDSGMVLINGERASVNLQLAESETGQPRASK
jgi:hypothetical protein